LSDCIIITLKELVLLGGENMHNFDYILWDWNGTIIDDFLPNFELINLLLKERGLPVISREEYRGSFRFPIVDFYRKIGFCCEGDAYMNLVREYASEYAVRIPSIGLVPGIERILAAVHADGIKQFIISASHRAIIEKQLAQYGISQVFDSIIASEDDFARGKIDLAERWMDKMHIRNPKRVLVIGDTLHDYDVSKRLHCMCILVNYGHQELALHSQKQDTICVSSATELKRVLWPKKHEDWI